MNRNNLKVMCSSTMSIWAFSDTGRIECELFTSCISSFLTMWTAQSKCIRLQLEFFNFTKFTMSRLNDFENDNNIIVVMNSLNASQTTDSVQQQTNTNL